MKKEYCVYCHKFPNEKYYIGLTRQKPEDRWGYNGSGYKDQLVYDAIKEFGWNNIEHIIVKNNLTSEEAQKLEIELINKFNSIDNGYNVSLGGGLGGDAWCEYEYNGVIYNANELAEMSIYDLTGHDITNRINEHGWSIEKALHTPKGRRNTTFNYNNNYYTVKQLYHMRENRDLSYNQIKTRLLKYNWDIERALTQPSDVKIQPFGTGEKIYEYNGKMYNSYELTQISNIDGLTSFDIADRINHHGWTVERAISTPKRKSNIKYLYNNNYYSANELLEFSTVENLKSGDIRDRLRNGWSVYDAIHKPKRNKTK